MKSTTRALFVACACVVAFIVAPMMPAQQAQAAEGDYQIYPTLHSISYTEGTQTVRANASVVVEDGIDADTKDRLDEVLALKGIHATSVDQIPTQTGTTSILVGINGSNGAVDAYVKQLVGAGKLVVEDGLFEKTDAYLLASIPGNGSTADQIIVLGRDTDSAFYGLTTLYQIFQQINGAQLRAFTVNDYADVKTRGFIEGYYGNPWSVQDRVNLMKWGGYYKLNAYVYAPKDDPKHNSQWRELYTEEELAQKIDPVAEAGNKSKTRFIFALHPFMHNPITASNYDESVPILKKKFTQVMDHGVRQIAILADDATNQGSELYTKLLKDMSDWIHEQQKAVNEDGSLKYPGLKDTIIFCPVNYTSFGESWYGNLPSNIQVVNTGGRVWGKIDNNFATQFMNNSGKRAPFMWINWPCSDNDKDALHMGGHNNFLGADVKPGTVEGVVLNPMQQSEPSKQAIFMNADFSWNLWESTEHADQTWEDSFSYVDHNSPIATTGSEALHDLSVNMVRMYGGGATWANNESAEFTQTLTEFRQKLANGTVTEEDCDQVAAIFKELQQTAAAYRANAGNEAMLTQITPWIDTWDDLTAAALLELEALKADLAGDTSTLIAKFSDGTARLDQANTNGFFYVDHTEYARVGKQIITPTVTELDKYVAERAELASNPNAVVKKFVTSRTDTPSGATDLLFDGKANTGISYKTPASVTNGTYFGVEQSQAFDLNRFSITYANDHLNDTIRTGKLQVLRLNDKGERTWSDVPNATVSDNRNLTVDFKNLNQTGVLGVRLIATADNSGDCWLTINEIEINKTDSTPAENAVHTGTVTVDKQVSADTAKPLQNASDGKDNTEVYLRKAAEGSDRDTTVKDAAVIVTFPSAVTIDTIVFKQGTSSASDVISAGKAYYQDQQNQWHEAGSINNAKAQTLKLTAPVQAKAIKVVNGADAAVWWRVADLYATLGTVTPTATPAITTNLGTYQTNAIANAIDGNATTKFWSNQNTAKDDWVMLAFGEAKQIDTVRMLQGTGDRFSASNVFATTDATPNATSGKWTQVATLTGAADQTVSFAGVQATAIKVVSTAATSSWFQLFELEAFEKYPFLADNVFANFELADNAVKAQVGQGQAAMSAATVQLPAAGDVVAIDLGKVRRQIAVNHANKPDAAKAELVYSQNGLEWLPVAGAEGDWRARYVGYRAKSEAASVNLADFSLTFLSSLAPKLVSSDVSGSGAFDVAKVFDNNVSTAATVQGYPAQNDTIVFDLGQRRQINSVEYFVPETSKDFIRNAVIEVADSADAQTWKTVLDINSKTPVVDTANEQTAKDATWLKHSSEFPGNMTISQEGANATGQFMRVRFTAPYSHRWVSFGELRINKGEYVSTYADGDFASTVSEQEGHTPDLMLDQNLATSWAPQGDKAGTMTYLLSEPLKADGDPYQGIRIISRGTPSNATVKAEVYTDDTYAQTQTVTLGTLSQVSQEFAFGNDRVVKNIMVEWADGATPQISELYLLGSAEKASAQAQAQLQAKIDQAKKADTSAWTKNSRDALSAAIAAGESSLKNADTLTADSVQYLIAALDRAMGQPVLKYTDSALSDLVKAALKDSQGYSAASWQAYQEALVAAQTALEDPENLSQSVGADLATKLQTAKDGLTWDPVARDRANQSLADSKARFGNGDFTKKTGEALSQAEAALQKLVDAATSTPAQLEAGMVALQSAQDGLVDISALRGERDEFAKVSAAAYTPESYAAYKAAFDASTPLMENGTAEQITPALTALQEARKALKSVAGSDSKALEALIAEAAKLNAEDYTPASWKPFAEALDTAKSYTGTDQAQLDKLAAALSTARTNLVNVTALKSAVANAEGLDLGKYTKDSADAVTAALQAAKTALQDGSAQHIEDVRAVLADAVKGLQLIHDPSGPGQTGEQGKTETSSPKPTNSGAQSGIAATGSSVAGILIALTACAGAGIALLQRRNRKD